MTDNAEEIKQEFKQFVYGVSHDLNSYARGMVEFAKLLKQEDLQNLTDDSKLYLEMIVENGERLSGIMNSLVEFSRINTMAKPFAVVDSNRTLQDSLIVLGEKIKTKKAKVTYSDLPKVSADADQLMQLFLALIDNALKFTDSGKVPEVHISAEDAGNDWLFKVKDNGIGIKPEYLPVVFIPFRRLNNYEEYQGTGLGLSLAKKVVSRHGGQIDVTSSESGSVFSFTLPKIKAA